MSGTEWRKLSSAALNLSRVGIDLMSGGTALYSAEAVDEKEWNLIVLMLLYLELPRGRKHVTPRLCECWKMMLTLLGITSW